MLDGTLTAAGHWTVSARGDLFAETTRLDVAVEADDLRGFAALTPLELASTMSGEFAASAVVVVPGRKGETPEAKITFQKVRLDLPERPGVLWLADPVTVTLARGRLTAGKVELRGEGTSLAIEGMYDTNGSGAADFTIKGSVDAKSLDLVLPDLALSGRLVADLKALGPPDHVVLAGTLRLEDGRYRLPGLSQIADEIQCVVRFAGGRAEIEGARAKIGGGDVYAAGTVVLDGLKPSDMRLTLQGRRVSFRYPQDLRLMADADLVLTAGSSGNWVRGEVVLLRGVYSKDFELTLASLLERAPVAALQPRDPWRARTSLDVRIVSASGLEVQNNVARLTATVDLVARGTLAEPTLVGQLTLVEGGRITFRNVRYEIETGNILFTGGREFAPVVDLRARAPLRGYDVVVSIAGTWPRLQTSFTSDPPLADDAVLGMLLSGTPPGGSGSTTTVASAASSIVADVVTSPISKGRAKAVQAGPVRDRAGLLGQPGQRPLDRRQTDHAEPARDLLPVARHGQAANHQRRVATHRHDHAAGAARRHRDHRARRAPAAAVLRKVGSRELRVENLKRLALAAALAAFGGRCGWTGVLRKDGQLRFLYRRRADRPDRDRASGRDPGGPAPLRTGHGCHDRQPLRDAALR